MELSEQLTLTWLVLLLVLGVYGVVEIRLTKITTKGIRYWLLGLWMLVGAIGALGYIWNWV